MKTTDLENTLNKVKDKDSLNAYLKDIDNELPASFYEYFNSLNKIPKNELIKKSGIERTYAYHILDGSKDPGRDKILRLCISASLSIEETNRCLKLAKESILYPKNQRDVLIQYAINKHFSVIETNLLLDEHDEEELI